LSDRGQGQKRTDQEVADAEAHRCLGRRIPDMATLICEVTAWEARRNYAHAKVIWQFTTAEARTKFRRLDPVMKEQNLT
jgi:hypothetical protein